MDFFYIFLPSRLTRHVIYIYMHVYVTLYNILVLLLRRMRRILTGAGRRERITNL